MPPSSLSISLTFFAAILTVLLPCVLPILVVVWIPGAGPGLGGILVLATTNYQVMAAFWLLMFYGMGAALPMVAIATIGRLFGRRRLKLQVYSAGLPHVGGVAITATALAILLGWDVQVQLWLTPLFPRQIL